MAAKDNGKEVAKVPTKQMPAFMRQDAGRGMRDIKASDYEMPRIKLLQGISEELTQFNGLKAGEFFHTLTEKSLGSSIPIVPLYVSKRYVLWNPRWDGGGILARADDAIHWKPDRGEFKVHTDKSKRNEVVWKLAPTVAASGLSEWGTADPSDPKSQPAATLCYVIVADLPEHQDISPVAIMLQRTAIIPARKFLGKLKISGAAIYGTRFIMSSFVENGDLGDYNNYRFAMDGFVDDEEMYNHYKSISEGFERSGVNVRDLESAQEDSNAASRTINEGLAQKV